MKNIINLIVEQNSDKKRIDTFIFYKCPELSRTRIKNLIIDNRLKINGKTNNLPSKKINHGDKVYLEVPEPKKTSLKPFNFKSMERLLKNKKNVLVVEDHVSHGGLSSLIYETIAKSKLNKINVKSLNLDEKFSESGTPSDLERANGFDPKSIAKIFYEKFKLAK